MPRHRKKDSVITSQATDSVKQPHGAEYSESPKTSTTGGRRREEAKGGLAATVVFQR